ncbi:MAG: FtsX-like permease family protein [Bacteroidia bacterium]
MLLLIAWRNIWRNKLRSLVIMLSIAIGLWAGIFTLSFSWGMYRSNLHDTVYKQISHIQVHHPKFLTENESSYSIKTNQEKIDNLRHAGYIHSVSSRSITPGMISSPTTASGVKIYGINFSDEIKQTGLDENIISGSYPDSMKSNQILIGEKLAVKLKVQVKSKIVLTFTDINNEICSAAFRIKGIYRSKNTSRDETVVYVKKETLNELLKLEADESNEIAILIKDENLINENCISISKMFPAQSVQTWMQISPELSLIINSFDLYTYIIIGIILLALTFGIINTMLMAVLERVREIGMLMAIGLNKKKIFMMIMYETIFLSFIGCPIGLGLGYLTISYLGKHGIDLSTFSKGLASYGFDSVIYPYLEISKYYITAFMTFIAALISSVYPALKALRLNPSQAIRKI